MNEQRKTLRACGALLLTAIIWGFAFVAQDNIAKHLGPFTCNALRFVVGTLVLLPFMLKENKKINAPVKKSDLRAGVIVGGVLFFAAFCQQAGMQDTGAGKAGFITALYVVLVPLVGALVFKQKTRLSTWLALLIALPGLYLLCIPRGESFTLAKGDLWMLLGALMWAFHILTTDYFAVRTTALKLCVLQFAVSAALNAVCALLFEQFTLAAIGAAALSVLYCGAMSNGVGYFLQTVGQKHAKPAHAALILCLESVFSAIGGALLLHERMSLQGYIGCLMMLFAVILSQLGMLKSAAKGAENHV